MLAPLSDCQSSRPIADPAAGLHPIGDERKGGLNGAAASVNRCLLNHHLPSTILISSSVNPYSSYTSPSISRSTRDASSQVFELVQRLSAAAARAATPAFRLPARQCGRDERVNRLFRGRVRRMGICASVDRFLLEIPALLSRQAPQENVGAVRIENAEQIQRSSMQMTDVLSLA